MLWAAVECHHGQRLSQQILYSVWLFSALILSTAYGAYFYSLITVPEFEPAIDTTEDLLEAISDDSRTILSYTKAIYLHKFYSATPESNNLYYQIGRHLNRTKQLYSTLENLIPRIEAHPRAILFGTRLYMATQRYLKASLPLHIASAIMEPDFVAILLPKKSPLREPFNLMYHSEYSLPFIYFLK